MLEMMKMMGGGDGKKVFDQFMLWRENSRSGSIGVGPSAGKAQGKGAWKISQGDKLCVGRLKTWFPDKQRGFIFAEDVFLEFGGMDVYAHQTLLESCGAGLGDTVAFFLHVHPQNGSPQASAPMIRISSSNTFALKGIYKPSPEGHGFLQSKLLYEFFGRDCYVNKDMAALIPPGAMVAFNAHLNKENVPNMDNNCEWVEDDWEPEPGDLKTGGTDDLTEQRRNQLKGKGKGTRAVMQNLVNQMAGLITNSDASTNSMGIGKTGEIYLGIVKTVTEGSNYGIISCEEAEKKYNIPVYFNCLAEDGRKATFGDMVEFHVSTDAQGKPQATSYRLLEGNQQSQPQPLPSIENGVAQQPQPLPSAENGAAQQSQPLLTEAAPTEPVAQPMEVAAA